MVAVDLGSSGAGWAVAAVVMYWWLLSYPLTLALASLTTALATALIYLKTAMRPRDILARLTCRDTALSHYVARHCHAFRHALRLPVLCRNKHVQSLMGLWAREPGVTFHRQYLQLLDGGLVSLDWETGGDHLPEDRPILLILPDLPQSCLALGALCREAFTLGLRAVVLNRRGQGHTPLRTPTLPGYGETGDLRQVVDFLRGGGGGGVITLSAVGVGTGADLLMSYLGEYGSSSHLCSAVCISPSYAAEKTWHHLSFPYSALYLSHLKKIVCDNAQVFGRELARKALGAWSVREFDRRLHCGSTAVRVDDKAVFCCAEEAGEKINPGLDKVEHKVHRSTDKGEDNDKRSTDKAKDMFHAVKAEDEIPCYTDRIEDTFHTDKAEDKLHCNSDKPEDAERHATGRSSSGGSTSDNAIRSHRHHEDTPLCETHPDAHHGTHRKTHTETLSETRHGTHRKTYPETHVHDDLGEFWAVNNETHHQTHQVTPQETHHQTHQVTYPETHHQTHQVTYPETHHQTHSETHLGTHKQTHLETHAHADLRAFWAVNEPLREADEVHAPVLCVSALDDPVCRAAHLTPTLPLFQALPNLFLLTLPQGGHAGFRAGLQGVSWAESAALDFLLAMLTFQHARHTRHEDEEEEEGEGAAGLHHQHHHHHHHHHHHAKGVVGDGELYEFQCRELNEGVDFDVDSEALVCCEDDFDAEIEALERDAASEVLRLDCGDFDFECEALECGDFDVECQALECEDCYVESEALECGDFDFESEALESGDSDVESEALECGDFDVESDHSVMDEAGMVGCALLPEVECINVELTNEETQTQFHNEEKLADLKLDESKKEVENESELFFTDRLCKEADIELQCQETGDSEVRLETDRDVNNEQTDSDTTESRDEVKEEPWLLTATSGSIPLTNGHCRLLSDIEGEKQTRAPTEAHG